MSFYHYSRCFQLLLLGVGLLAGLLTSLEVKAQSGYVKLIDGTRLTGKLKVKSPERLVFRPDTGPATEYAPAEVAYFVMGRDSFVVVTGMDVYLDEQDQHFERGFARVLLNRAGYEAYQVVGRADAVGSMAVGGPAIGPGVMAPPMIVPVRSKKAYDVIIFRSPRSTSWVTLPRNQRELSNMALQFVANDASLAEVARSPAFTAEQFPLLIADWLRSKGQ